MVLVVVRLRRYCELTNSFALGLRMGEIIAEVVYEGDNRPLTERDKELLAKGKEPVGGAALMAEGQNHPETLWDARAKIAELHMLKRQAKALADLEGFVDAHREQAHRIYGAKLGVILGLLDEMLVTNEDGSQRLDTTKLDDKRLKVLMTYVDQFEKRAFGSPATVTKHEGEVDVRHVVAETRQKLIDAS